MEIRILELIEGAKKAEGLTVIIDVFRAFSLECYLYARGASAVFPAGSVEEARHMKQVHPEYLLILYPVQCRLPDSHFLRRIPNHTHRIHIS